jgi:hypothetical protein
LSPYVPGLDAAIYLFEYICNGRNIHVGGMKVKENFSRTRYSVNLPICWSSFEMIATSIPRLMSFLFFPSIMIARLL